MVAMIKKGEHQGQGPGCKEVCRKCQQPWGSPALQVMMGEMSEVMVMIIASFQCFRKDHSTVESSAGRHKNE